MNTKQTKYHFSIIRSEEEITKWDRFVNNNQGGFFQSIWYYRFCCLLDEYEPIIIVVYDNHEIVGSLLAVIQKTGQRIVRFFSRRTIVIGGPIVEEEMMDSDLLEVLLKGLDFHIGKKAIYTEFRNLFNLSGYIDSFKKYGYHYKEHLNVQLSLRDKENVLRQISSSKRRQIRKSVKNGAKITEPKNLEEIRTFFHILRDLYKKKVKKPLPSWDFFKKLYELGQKSDCIKFFLIKYNGEILGGILSPIYNGTIYEWYIATRDIETKDVYPAVLATWSAIDYGINNNLRQFDFLGAGKPDEDYGVRDFKLKFGGELLQYGRFIKPNQKLLYSLGIIALRVLKNM